MEVHHLTGTITLHTQTRRLPSIILLPLRSLKLTSVSVSNYKNRPQRLAMVIWSGQVVRDKDKLKVNDGDDNVSDEDFEE